MTTFWIVVALLLACALGFVLPPLLRRERAGVAEEATTVSLYRDQLAELGADLRSGTLTAEQFEHARLELERRLLEEIPATGGSHAVKTGSIKGRRWGAVAIALVVPVLAVSLYLYLGNPKTIAPGNFALSTSEAHSLTRDQLAVMVGRLVQKLKTNPNDARGWYMLARSYAAFERWQDAAAAYEKAATLAPDDPQVLTDYADTLSMVNGGNLDGKPLQLIRAALKLDPNQRKALALAGTAAFNSQNFPLAVEYWERLQKVLPADTEAARAVAASIAEARAADVRSDANQGGAQTGRVDGTVTLSPSLAGKAAPTDTLFIFARAVNGPKMPLAIVRAQVKDMPKTFTLDDSMAMAPAMKLSGYSEVIVGARVSKSGNAIPQSGDLQGTIGPVKVGSTGVNVVIADVVP